MSLTVPSHPSSANCSSVMATSSTTSLPPLVLMAKRANPKVLAAQAALRSLPHATAPTNSVYLLTMELVWHGEFDRLFAQYFPHAWYLVPTFCPPTDRWRVFKDSAKVRFSCQGCGHGWTSGMKGRVIFWFHLNYSTNSGYVMFKLYGQQCQKCKNGNYEHAMWYPEEVVKVICNIYNRVGQIFYGFERPPLNTSRREGKPKNQHNADLCQACKEGLCKGEWYFY
ncbi:LOW QUALITY PROTEIN: receptor-transporting protein 3 [Aplysia californica]|uniref:LOW QUALITY PROTEIN: receptor-transporting protein 3 n=1 Tax=Aplysia californica TaxID=6500 RepID=A0ABM1AAX3_APLCA|nr:LOW QUALITY PROTEIN: receptor-transporting protein 3 [Aplysia californica]